MSTIFWNLIHNGLLTALTISILIGIFYLYGHIVMSVVSQREQPTTIVISAGMAMITFAAWYCYRLGIQIYSFITVAVAIAIILAGISTIKKLRSAENQKLATTRTQCFSDFQIIPAIILAFAAQSVIAFKFVGQPIGRIGNNDIFSWALMADHFLGNANINNITPEGTAFFNSLSTDAWGTYFNLAMAAKIGGLHSLEATPSFVVMCLTLITFALYEIAKKAFALPSTVALIVATLTGTGSFLFYIAYNGFYGQLLGTIFFLNLLLSILNSNDNDDFLTTLTTLSLSFIGLLLVYQSGFFVFTVFSFVFCVLQTIHNRYFPQIFSANILTKFHTPIFQLLLALAISITVLPELSWHTIQRTLYVSGVTAGWPLPLISPAYLLSLPICIPFLQLEGTTIHYGLAALFFGLVVFISPIQFKNKDIKMPSSAFSLVALLGLSISTYALAYYIKGGAYQTWKLAAFIVIPSSFAINALIAKSIHIACSSKSKGINLIVFIFFISIALFNFVSIPFRSILDPYSSKVDGLKAIRETALAEGVKTIILGTPPFGDTMAAFNYLSKDFKLIPLSQSYIPSTKMPELNPVDKTITRLLIPAKCEGNQLDASKISRYILTTVEKVTFEKFNFNATDTDCSSYSGVTLVQGFSSSESWGTWTIGDRASIEVIVPINLQGKDLVTKFEINPFGEQSVVIKGNGVILGSYVLKGQTTLTIKVPSELPKSNKMIFDFTISNPRLASEFNPDNHDPRLLGLGFVSLMLTDSSPKHTNP